MSYFLKHNPGRGYPTGQSWQKETWESVQFLLSHLVLSHLCYSEVSLWVTGRWRGLGILSTRDTFGIKSSFPWLAICEKPASFTLLKRFSSSSCIFRASSSSCKTCCSSPRSSLASAESGYGREFKRSNLVLKLVRDPKSSTTNRTNGHYNERQDKQKMKRKKNFELVMKEAKKESNSTKRQGKAAGSLSH